MNNAGAGSRVEVQPACTPDLGREVRLSDAVQSHIGRVQKVALDQESWAEVQGLRFRSHRMLCLCYPARWRAVAGVGMTKENSQVP